MTKGSISPDGARRVLLYLSRTDPSTPHQTTGFPAWLRCVAVRDFKPAVRTCPRNKDLSYELEAVQGHTPHLHPTTSPTRPTSAATTAPTPGHRLSIPPSGSSGDTAVRMQTAMDGADGAEPSGDAGGGPRTAEHISCAVSLSAAEMSIAKATAGRARTGTASSCQRRLFGAVSCIRRLHLNGMRQS